MQVSGQVTTMPFDKCYTEPLFKVVQIVPDMREHGKEVSEAWNVPILSNPSFVALHGAVFLNEHIYLTHKEILWSEVKSLSRVWLFATPWTVAYQAPLSMEFSRQ